MANDIHITSYTGIGVGISTSLLERKFSFVELIQQYVSSTLWVEILFTMCWQEVCRVNIMEN